MGNDSLKLQTYDGWIGSEGLRKWVHMRRKEAGSLYDKCKDRRTTIGMVSP